MALALPSLTFTRCTLLYRTADSDDWLALQGLGDTTFNVKNVLFDDGLTFTQSEAGNETKCIVKVSVRGSPSVKVSDDDKLTPATLIDVKVVCDKVHNPIFTSTAKTDKARSDGIALARTFPLATMSKNFAAIRLPYVALSFLKSSIQTIQGSAQTSQSGILKEHLETLLMLPALDHSVVDASASRNQARIDVLRAELKRRKQRLAEEGRKIAGLEAELAALESS